MIPDPFSRAVCLSSGTRSIGMCALQHAICQKKVLLGNLHGLGQAGRAGCDPNLP